MLALTENPVQAVRGIVSSSDEAPEMGGLRVVADHAGGEANFQLSVAGLPAEDDEVVEEQGGRVFLDPEAASLLADKVLDASVEQNRSRSRSRSRSSDSPSAFAPYAFTDRREKS